MANDLKQIMADFTNERDWDKFHNAKNFACAICAEAGELMDEVMWMKDETANATILADADKHARVKSEAADIYMNLIQLSRHLDFNLEEELLKKLEKVKLRYPAEECRTVGYIKRHEIEA